MSDFSNSLHFVCSNNYVFLIKSKSGSYALEVWLFFFWNPFFFKSVILLRNYVIFYEKRQFCGFFRFLFIFIKLFNIYWKINIILLLPLFSTLKKGENGLPKNCWTTNRKHCATVQVWGVVEPQWIFRGWASSVDPFRVKQFKLSFTLILVRVL